LAKKSGKECTAKVPEAPEKALEANTADLGKVSEANANPSEQEKGQFGSTEVKSTGPPETPEETSAEETHWIGIELKDEEGNPIPNEPFMLRFPDGTIYEGNLDDEGKFILKGLAPGDYEVCFPEIDKDQWRPA